MATTASKTLTPRAEAAREKLDAWVREVVAWHFDPQTGTPFWLEWAESAGFDPRKTVKGYADLDRFGFFQDEWLRGGPVRRFVPKGYANRADLDLRDRRLDRRAEVAHQHRRLPDRLRDVQRDAARRVLPEGRRLAARRARAARAGCGSRSSTCASTAAGSASWSTSTRAG